jgi:hypothetical protein
MKKYRGVEMQLHYSSPRHYMEIKKSASRTGRFTSVERAPNTQWIAGWVDPRAGLDTVEKNFLLVPRI